MGSSQSVPRKVTLENPEENVIKITESVVDRIQAARKQEVRKEAPVTSDVADPTFVTSQQIRREVDREIERNNIHWESRIKILRDGYKKITAELEDAYNEATKEVNKSLGTHFAVGNVDHTDACKNSQKSVIDCYNRNRDQPLLCSNEVQKFNECVSSGMSMVVKTK